MYKIHTTQLVADIRSGMGDAALMSKYDLSRKLYQRLLQRLVDEKVVGHQDLYQWSPMYKHISDALASRRQPRTYVPIAVRVLHNGGSQQGFIRDISEIGLRTAGIEAEVGEAMTLSMPLTEIPGIGSIKVKAVCRWSEKKGYHTKFPVSGFEITTASEEQRRRLLQLIDRLRRHGEKAEEEAHGDPNALRVSNTMSLIGPSCGSREFSGRLEGIDILDLVQFMLWSRQDKVIEVQSCQAELYELHLRNGSIVHARGGDLEGTEAFFACVNCSGGQFSTRSWTGPEKRSISDPADYLLIEAARRRDETN